MKGSAPKSPETGSQASRVKNFQPKAARLSCERAIRIKRIKRTMAKILQAQTIISVAKLTSASLPLPRLLRKSRIGETGGDVTCSSALCVGRLSSAAETDEGTPCSFSILMQQEKSGFREDAELSVVVEGKRRTNPARPVFARRQGYLIWAIVFRTIS